MHRAVLIYNPVAGRHRADRLIRDIEATLRGAGFITDSQPTSGPGDGTRLARLAVAQGVSTVLVLGGDGSLRECVRGLLGSDTAVGFLPAGTANVMARTLGIPSNPLAAARALADGDRLAFDVGLCNEEPFLMQASAGLDAEVLRRVEPARKRLLGRAEIALAALAGWHGYEYPRFSVRWDGGSRDVGFVAACNIPYYGGRFRLAPTANWNDGELDLVLATGHGRVATLGLARDLALGRIGRRQDVSMIRVREATVDAAPGLALQLDGDPLPDALPGRIRVAAGAVTMLAPRSVVHRTDFRRRSSTDGRNSGEPLDD